MLGLIEKEIDEKIEINSARILQVTSQLPADVDDTYNRILCKIWNPEKAKKILYIVMGAVRPPTVEEPWRYPFRTTIDLLATSI